MDNISKYKIFIFWTGNNEMSENRKKGIQHLKEVSECEIVIINKDNLNEYILPDHPLHEGYKYLSFVHKADYLRTYFMNFIGGGYSDIKKTRPPNRSKGWGTWKEAFDQLKNSDKWINGYRELAFGVSRAHPELKPYWYKLIGNGCYIAKPQTELTKEWYKNMIEVMDKHLEELKKHPARSPRDANGYHNSKYPIKWTELLGDIFHPVCYKYSDKILQSVPIPNFEKYK